MVKTCWKRTCHHHQHPATGPMPLAWCDYKSAWKACVAPAKKRNGGGVWCIISSHFYALQLWPQQAVCSMSEPESLDAIEIASCWMLWKKWPPNTPSPTKTWGLLMNALAKWICIWSVEVKLLIHESSSSYQQPAEKWSMDGYENLQETFVSTNSI